MSTLTPRNQKSNEASRSPSAGENELDSSYQQVIEMQAELDHAVCEVLVGVIQCIPDPHRQEVINVGLITKRREDRFDLYLVDPQRRVAALGYPASTTSFLNEELAALQRSTDQSGRPDLKKLVHIRVNWSRYIFRGRYETWIREMIQHFCGGRHVC